MAVSFKLWNDLAMTDEFVYASDKIVTSASGDKVLYLGSTNVNRKLQANSDPGVDQITVTPTDSEPGTGHETSEIKLADTLLGLDSAVAGAALDLGTTLFGGTAYPIHIRLTDATGGVASTELSLQFNTVVEYSYAP